MQTAFSLPDHRPASRFVRPSR